MNINLKLTQLIGSDIKTILKNIQRKASNVKTFIAINNNVEYEQREES